VAGGQRLASSCPLLPLLSGGPSRGDRPGPFHHGARLSRCAPVPPNDSSYACNALVSAGLPHRRCRHSPLIAPPLQAAAPGQHTTVPGHLAIAEKPLKPSRGTPGRNFVRGPAAPRKAKTTPPRSQALVRRIESNTKCGVTPGNSGDEFWETLQVSGIRERFGRGVVMSFRHEIFMWTSRGRETRPSVEW
jgi:hypothetical protein